MIPDDKRDAIQAEAYRKLTKLIANNTGDDAQFLCDVYNIREEAELELQKLEIDVNAILTRLHSTRLMRLPRTQFVYWPAHQQVTIRRANDEASNSYLQEHVVAIDLAIDYIKATMADELYEALCDAEARHFSTDDELVVYWRGQHSLNLWTVGTSHQRNSGLTFQAVYGPIHIYGGETHVESRKDKEAQRARTHNMWHDYRENK